eukprot:1182314-Prorocentrum_minimum.AAC.1
MPLKCQSFAHNHNYCEIIETAGLWATGDWQCCHRGGGVSRNQGCASAVPAQPRQSHQLHSVSGSDNGNFPASPSPPEHIMR